MRGGAQGGLHQVHAKPKVGKKISIFEMWEKIEILLRLSRLPLHCCSRSCCWWWCYSPLIKNIPLHIVDRQTFREGLGKKILVS